MLHCREEGCETSWVKPDSIKLFDMLFSIAAFLALVSAVLSFDSLQKRALLAIGSEGGRAMASWLASAWLFIFPLLAAITWSAISILRMGRMRWVLGMAVVFSAYHTCRWLAAFGPHPVGLLYLAATVAAGAAMIQLFRTDASAWFTESGNDSVIP